MRKKRGGEGGSGRERGEEKDGEFPLSYSQAGPFYNAAHSGWLLLVSLIFERRLFARASAAFCWRNNVGELPMPSTPVFSAVHLSAAWYSGDVVVRAGYR